MPHLGYLRGETVRHLPGRSLSQRVHALVGPAGLARYSLRGARPAGPIRLVIARDVSASMSPMEAPRETALTELLGWLPRNLRPNDEIGVLDFAVGAQWVMRPTVVQQLAAFGPSLLASTLDGGGTEWRPVIDRVQGLPAHRTRTSLWLVSDGQYPDYPASTDIGRRMLQDAGIHSMPLLIPTDASDVPRAWADAFPDEPCLTFDGMNAHATAMAFAHALVTVTGQRLIRDDA